MVYQPSPYIVPAERPLLIFNHNPKAGGGTIKALLDDAFDCQIDARSFFYESKFSSKATVDKAIEDNCYVLAHETTHTGFMDREKGFLIGSVREPCSHYLSLWAYGSTGHGGVHSRLKRRHKTGLLGQDGPHFDSDRDIERFHAFLKDDFVSGTVRNRFESSYYENGHLEVDCFVFVDDFQRSLVNCLMEYELQGGYVNWNSAKMLELVQTAKEKGGDGGRRELEDVVVPVDPHESKNNVGGDPRLDHHSSCSTYYDEETIKLMENGPESDIFETFGYKCCGTVRSVTAADMKPTNETQISRSSLVIPTIKLSFANLAVLKDVSKDHMLLLVSIALALLFVIVLVCWCCCCRSRNSGLDEEEVEESKPLTELANISKDKYQDRKE